MAARKPPKKYSASQPLRVTHGPRTRSQPVRGTPGPGRTAGRRSYGQPVKGTPGPRKKPPLGFRGGKAWFQ